ncbi:oligosaccharide flippase family protein [Photobacterium toruni]|uniref:Oligosaccharide flippase family protein n=1 Tax=Photobacterium toruni TaxID=1935446 RepID=A0A1T4QKF8_9GAMM|nr:oligosaccharide flippase family protein [Photobacterium toruni]MEC6830891.1 oligosaccharide flippase family protein [Photobacterium toruni]SKA03738.1 hypothetical protein CZ814_01040 [Photobacterium toruni]
MFSTFIIIKNNWLLFSCVSLAIIKDILKVGLPLVPHSIGIFILVGADKFIIGKILGLTTISSYLVVFQISAVFIFVFDAINKSYYPWLFEKLNENNEKTKKKLWFLTYIYFILLLIISIFFFFHGSTLITLIAGKNYIINDSIVGLIFLGQIFGGMYLMINNYLFYEKRTSLISMITIISGAIHLLLISLFSYYFGITGAALSFCLSKCLQFLLTWVKVYETTTLSLASKGE